MPKSLGWELASGRSAVLTSFVKIFHTQIMLKSWKFVLGYTERIYCIKTAWHFVFVFFVTVVVNNGRDKYNTNYFDWIFLYKCICFFYFHLLFLYFSFLVLKSMPGNPLKIYLIILGRETFWCRQYFKLLFCPPWVLNVKLSSCHDLAFTYMILIYTHNLC